MSTAPFTGRANLFAERPGVLVVDRPASIALNDVDPAITFATLAGLRAGRRRRDDRDGQDHPVRGAAARARQGGRRCARREADPARCAVPVRKVGVDLDHAARPRRQGDRQDPARSPPSGSRPRAPSIVAEKRVPHETAGARRRRSTRCSRPGAELVVVFGASAIADRRDVIPAAIEAAGGRDRAFRHAGRSGQSAAGRRSSAAGRCSARRAARAARRKTASTGC